MVMWIEVLARGGKGISMSVTVWQSAACDLVLTFENESPVFCMLTVSSKLEWP